MPNVAQTTYLVLAKSNNCRVQLLQHPTNKKFMYNFWALRNRLIKDIGGKIRTAHALDLSDMFLLQHVLDHDASPSELAELMSIPAHGISRKLENLQELGMLERTLHPTDARKRVLTVTDKGKKALKASFEMMDKELDTFLSVLSKKDLAIFINHLEKLANTDSS
jgi:DNA-binding MarR family transcriptional regulator